MMSLLLLRATRALPAALAITDMRLPAARRAGMRAARPEVEERAATGAMVVG